MKNTKTKIILSTIIFLSVAGFAGIVSATNPVLYVAPASLTKTIGSTLDVSIRVNASGSKVCAVEGTVVFNNLFCQSMTVASDATPQSSPTCSNPHFLIGVPSCTTADKVLFTISVKAGNTGTASISFTGVDIIGEGVSVGSASINGNYTINAVPKSTTTTKKSTTTREPTTTIEPTTTEPTTTEPTTTTQPTTTGTGNVWVGILVGLIIFAIVVYVIYVLIHGKRKNSGKI